MIFSLIRYWTQAYIYWSRNLEAADGQVMHHWFRSWQISWVSPLLLFLHWSPSPVLSTSRSSPLGSQERNGSFLEKNPLSTHFCTKMKFSPTSFEFMGVWISFLGSKDRDEHMHETDLLVILVLDTSSSSVHSYSAPLFVHKQQQMGEVILHEQSVKDWSLAGEKPRCFNTSVPKWNFSFFGGFGSIISKGQGYIKEVIEVSNPFQITASLKSHLTVSHTNLKWIHIVCSQWEGSLLSSLLI